MYFETKTFEFTYRVFEPGDIITRTSNRSSLPDGQHVVTKFVKPEPYFYGHSDSGFVFIEGHDHGFDAEYVDLISDEEE